jgi:predicted O-methyltransferase YrrM
MSLNGLFGILDYLIYLVQSTNRHGVHSPFVYHFTDKILYGKTTCAYEPAAEMCRKRMVQSSRKVTLNGQQESLSKIALGLIPSSKYNRLLFRMIQEKQLGQYIIEIGSSLAITPLYAQRGLNDFTRYLVFDKHDELLNITQFNLKEYGCNETVVTERYSLIDEIIANLENLPPANIDLLIINEPLSAKDFWKLADWAIPRLGEEGCILMTTIRQSQDQQLLWQQLQNQKEITVGIDLFAMGMAFARKSQEKENFILRY